MQEEQHKAARRVRRPDRYGRANIVDAKFLALQKKWYDKLEAAGFEDIEPRPERLVVNSYLKGHHIEAGRRLRRGVVTGKAELFRLASLWIHINPWRTRMERWTWAAWITGWDRQEMSDRFPVLGKQRVISTRVRTMARTMLSWFAANPEPIEPEDT